MNVPQLQKGIQLPRGGGKPGAAKPPRPPAAKPPQPTGASKPPPSPRPTGGHWVPVGDNWVLIHATGPNQWARGPAQGRQAPPRPTGPTPLPTNPLAPLTPKQVRRTATGTITAAYAPQFGGLSQQESTARNLYDKQASDAKYFSDWLSQKGLEMTSAVGSVNKNLADLVTHVNARTAAQQAAIPGMAADTTTATGASAPNIYGQQIPGVLAAQGLRDQGTESGVASKALLGPIDVTQASTVNQARVQALRAASFDQLNKTMNDVAATRSKLQQAQTGDIAKEIARLQGVEISKRQWLRSQGDLEAQLNLKSQVDTANILLGQGKLKVAQTQAATGAQNAAETRRHNQAVEQINSTHYATQAQHDAAVAAETHRHNQATERQAAKSGTSGSGGGNKTATGVKAGTTNQQRVIRQRLTGLIGALKLDYKRYHSGKANGWSLAYQDILNGNAAAAGIIPRWTGDTGMMNAALNVAKGYGLTPGDLDYLSNQGLANVGGYYKIHGR